jgi:6-pyruvoyltetrahydropterin/6-carboxytetrahydropterin synthase
LFTVSVEMGFRASHQLTLPDGSKEATHRHNWSVTADVAGEKLDNMGVVMDFRRLRAALGGIIAELADLPLNDIGYFQSNNPSAENVAKYIYDKLQARLPGGIELQGIKVGEEPGCWAKFNR